MDSSTEEILLQKIEELVHDEDKIVTNSIVCENFDLSLTDAKHILEKYVSDANINPEKISVTYLICGKLKTGEYSIQIVDSIVLKERKKLYSSISNEVVYSVQKNNTIDFNAIALAQKSHTLKASALKGSIVGENCIEQLVKSKVLPPPPPQKIFEKQKPTSFFKPVVKTETNGEKQACQPNPSKNTETKAQSQKKIGGLAGFLSQCSNNSNNESKQNLKKTSSSEEDVRETKRPRLEMSDSKQSEAKEEKKPEVSKVENDSTESHNSKKEKKSGKSENRESSKENKPSKKSSNKKKQEGKKRKRIIVESESEDDLFANDEEEEKMDVDIEEEKPVIAQAKEIIPKNKRRKAIEKVYTDDEGFVVTKTEYVLVSASEDEADVKDEKPKVKPVDKEEKKSPPQKVAAKGKKGKKLAANQTTLMSFFTKK